MAASARLTAIGQPPPLDGLIASLAVVNELTLVTQNTQDFERFEGIRLENWYKTSGKCAQDVTWTRCPAIRRRPVDHPGLFSMSKLR
jgi:hypothetical protein